MSNPDNHFFDRRKWQECYRFPRLAQQSDVTERPQSVGKSLYYNCNQQHLGTWAVNGNLTK